MKKEKVFIVISHKHSLKLFSKTEWELTETIEIVNQLRNRHRTMSVAIGDYINKKMLSGTRSGITTYAEFDNYVRTKYPEQMNKVDSLYSTEQVASDVVVEVESVTDTFGNTREKTVFDV